MSPEQQRRILEEIARRALVKSRQESALAPILASAFDRQREFILHPAKYKALFCTRRSAKSYTGGLYLTHEAQKNAGCNCLFIGLTRMSAKGIVWKDVLKEIDTRHGIGMRPNEAELTMTTPNGSVIYVTGADANEDEMKKLLGKKYRLVVIDEASMYSVDVRNLVYGILGPAMTDPNAEGERGTIAMLGTASNFPRGLFFDVTTGAEPGWELFEWTAYDNPHVAKQWAEAIEEIREKRPLYMETPQFRQWYLNQWVVDEEKLCYRFSPQINLISVEEFERTAAALSPAGWAKVLGGDTGWEDDNALVSTAYHENDPNCYVLRSFAKKKLTFDQFADKIDADFMRDPRWAPHRVVIDGANKQGVESMRQRSNIPFEYADKQDKVTFIELCNSDLIQGRIKILDTPENRPLWEEMCSLVWQTDGDKIRFPKREHPALPNHRCDAFLYAWRCGFHYHWEKAEKKPPTGSKAWYEAQAENIWEKERERLLQDAQKPFWSEDEGGWGVG